MYKAQGAILARQPRGLTPWQLGTWALPLVLSTTQRPGAVTDSCPLSIGELGRLPQNHAKSWGSCSQSGFVITWINHTSSIFKPNTVFVRRDLRHCLHLSAEAIHILNANGEKAWSWRHPSLRMTQKVKLETCSNMSNTLLHSLCQSLGCIVLTMHGSSCEYGMQEWFKQHFPVASLFPEFGGKRHPSLRTPLYHWLHELKP
jgi:hypothetical protein